MKFMQSLGRYIYPAALMGLGLLLMLNPDSLSALLSQALGWVVLAVGIGFVIAALSDTHSRFSKVAGALICFALGTWLLRNPLALAQGIGRLAGICLLLRGGQDILRSSSGAGRALSWVTAALGLVLLLLPMATSRLVFSGIGVVLLALGVYTLVTRLRQRKLEDKGPIDL